ncbi:MAG: hypothetical protein HYS24_15205 [Ignavibacteriales bacterium]|nr:hypothetical protein [Ignavibacteriales bacterium]
MNKQIKIVTGKVHTGKTTRLFAFVNSHKSVDGILVPVIHDKRMIYNISSKELKQLEVDNNSNKCISVGKYNFLNESFSWANKKLIDGFSKNPEWIILDEIGKLELEKKGLFESADFILTNFRNTKTNIIFVIRDYLLDAVLKSFKLNENEIEIMNL